MPRDEPVRAPRGVDAQAADVDPVHLPDRADQRRGVGLRRTPQQRAVDVPEQEEGGGGQRSNETSAVSRWANAAISRAHASTSSSWTISTGECM
jgi:hypothetical protein